MERDREKNDGKKGGEKGKSFSAPVRRDGVERRRVDELGGGVACVDLEVLFEGDAVLERRVHSMLGAGAQGVGLVEDEGLWVFCFRF